MEELNILNSLIITSHEHAQFEQNKRTIKALPYWEWVLTEI